MYILKYLTMYFCDLIITKPKIALHFVHVFNVYLQ